MTAPPLTLFAESGDVASSQGPTLLRMEVHGPRARPAVLQLWRDTEARLSNQRLMCSSAWTETWLKHYGSLVPHRFAVAWRGDTCCGMALLTNGVRQFDGPMPLKTWHIGTAGEPDADSVCIEYNALLIGHEDREDFARQLIAWTSSQSDCDENRLDGFSAADIAPLLAAQPQAVATRKPSHYFDLNAAREANVAPIELLGRRTRASLRRSLRQLGQPTGEWANTPERAEAMLLELMDLHQARWEALGEPGVYSSRRFREFHLDLVQRLVPLGKMGLYRVASSNGVIGVSQVFLDDNRALLYQGGWAPQTGDASPGLVVDYLFMEECLRRGFDQFDFLAGESGYKRRLSTHEAELVWAVARRPRLKFAVLDNLRWIKRTLTGLDESPLNENSPIPTSTTLDAVESD